MHESIKKAGQAALFTLASFAMSGCTEKGSSTETSADRAKVVTTLSREEKLFGGDVVFCESVTNRGDKSLKLTVREPTDFLITTYRSGAYKDYVQARFQMTMTSDDLAQVGREGEVTLTHTFAPDQKVDLSLENPHTWYEVIRHINREPKFERNVVEPSPN